MEVEQSEDVDILQNILMPKRIKELLGHSFFVDSYQRGYRWGKTEVKALLNDLNDFSNKINKANNETYWLQPIIIKEVEKEIENNLIKCYELIDGQQRLTTIYLIYSFLEKKSPYNIYYNTRTSSLDFLQKINSFVESTWEDNFQNTESDKIDNFHFFNAYKTIQDWFENHSDDTKKEFLKTLLLDTNIIWYELVAGEESLPKTVFEQINIGKIPLTNAELVKALYLNSSVDEIRKNEIAEKWDRMEYALNDKSFWAFISNNVNHSHNRIEYLLNLISGKFDDDKSKEEKLHTFIFFNNQQDKNILWKKVEEYFQTLLGWYENAELYHYIGFLIQTKFSSINKLMKLYNNDDNKNQPKSNFKTEIIAVIKDKLKNYVLDDLRYGKAAQNEKIQNILLLFNIQTTLNFTPYNYFPFDKYKRLVWSLEHIHAQNSEIIVDPDAIKSWIYETRPSVNSLLNDVNKGENAKDLLRLFDDTLKQGANMKMGELSQKAFELFGDNNEVDHSIGNLALLDKDTNSKLNNSVFPLKRNKIFETESIDKVFIPICTKNVFLKYYSKNVSHIYFWSTQDKIDYLKTITDCLISFIPSQNKKEKENG